MLAERENEVASIHSKGAIIATAPITMMIKITTCCKRRKLRWEDNHSRTPVTGRVGEIFSEEAMIMLLIEGKTHAARTIGN